MFLYCLSEMLSNFKYCAVSLLCSLRAGLYASLFTFHFSLFTFHFSLFTFHFLLFAFHQQFSLSPRLHTTFTSGLTRARIHTDYADHFAEGVKLDYSDFLFPAQAQSMVTEEEEEDAKVESPKVER